MHTPSDPTAALAALIAGNQRHVQRRVEGRAASAPRPSPASARPFAVTIEIEPVAEALPDLFDVSPEQVQSFVLHPGSREMRSGRFEVVVPSEEELVRVVDGSVDALGFALVVVLGRLRAQAGVSDIAFAGVEQRCFGIARRLLSSGGRLSGSVAAGRMRMVGAIVDERDGRVHWLGEHPEQRVLVGGPRGK